MSWQAVRMRVVRSTLPCGRPGATFVWALWAIEALWGVDTPEVRAFLHAAARDPDNRVVGNALMGLYRLEDASAVPALLKMTSHESRRFRATAAWVMGETKDARFTKALAGML